MGTRKVPWAPTVDWEPFNELSEKTTVESAKSLWQEWGISGLQLWAVAQNTHVLISVFKLSFLLGSGLSALVLKTFTEGPISPYALVRGGDMERDFIASHATKIAVPSPSDPEWNNREVTWPGLCHQSISEVGTTLRIPSCVWCLSTCQQAFQWETWP